MGTPDTIQQCLLCTGEVHGFPSLFSGLDSIVKTEASYANLGAIGPS